MAAEVHIGDVGTLYRVTITDSGTPLDLTPATTTELIFRFGAAAPVVKPATVETDGTYWYLVCEAEAGFHAQAGPYRVQARVVFPDGSVYHSDVRSADDAGRELRVHSNLD